MTEFASAFTILICCLLIPLINFSVVPVRYVVAFAMVSDMTHKLSFSETRGLAVRKASEPLAYQNLAQNFGIALGASSLEVVCIDSNAQSETFSGSKEIPQSWLPGGSKGQCNYLLRIKTPIEIPPLFSFGPRIAALTAPIPIEIISTTPWENLGCDPVTQKFYINE